MTCYDFAIVVVNIRVKSHIQSLFREQTPFSTHDSDNGICFK